MYDYLKLFYDYKIKYEFFFVKFKYKIGNFDILSESYSYSSH